jgi:hypothetical protein
MQQREEMTIVNSVVDSNGRLVVTVEWPDGQFRVLDRDEAVGFSLTVLNAAARLFPTAEEFSHTIAFARGKIENLHPSNTLQ